MVAREDERERFTPAEGAVDGEENGGRPRILLLHGANLSQLGRRDPGHYGPLSLEELVALARGTADELGADLDHEQHDSESGLVDRVHASAVDGTDALIINPGAFAHYSYALRDALGVLDIPKIEVHLSNVHAREDFRQRSVIAAVCDFVLGGAGPLGYRLAVDAAIELCR